MTGSDVQRPALAEPLLRVTLFGQMQARDAAGRDVLPRSRKTRAVLAILALAAPKLVLRSRLTALLWSLRAKEQAQASLRQSVYELQRTLGPEAAGLVHADRNQLGLLDHRLWVDVRVLARSTVSHPDGLALFQPTMLDDLGGLDPAFDTWLATEMLRASQRARSVAEGVLAASSEARAQMAAAEQMLAIDPLYERAWQKLMSAHLLLGDRGAARQVFDRCAASLSAAGLAPAKETERLIDDGRRIATVASGPLHRTARRGLRMAVLPPRALDGSAAETFLPGLAEDITAAVSRFRWISCLLPMADQTRSPDQLGPGLDADYILNSAVQRSGDRIRVIVRLIDIAAGGTIAWVRQFDRRMADVLTLQGEIAAETAAQIDPELLLREGERLGMAAVAQPTAYDFTLRAIPAIYRLEPGGFHAAGDLLASATAMDPGNAAAHAWSAYWHLLLIGQAWADDPAVAAQRAGELAERAVTLDPGDARALTLVGHVRAYIDKHPEEGLSLHEKALSLNPNLPLAWCFSGLACSYLGRHEEAIERITRAQRLSPADPHAFFFDMALMMPHFMRRDYASSLQCGRRAVELNPGCTSTYKGYLATLGQLGHAREAARIAARLVSMEPGFSLADAAERSPLVQSEDLTLYLDGLRLAGVR